MSTEVSIAAALLAGLLSFLSPCVLPLVPPYIVYLTGVSCGQHGSVPTRQLTNRRTALTAALFVAGFSTVFIALGVGASAVGRLLRFYASELAVLAGIVICLMGLHFLGLTRVKLFMRQARFDMRRPIGPWGAYLMGLAFGFGWTPCVGPMLAAILAVAASDKRKQVV